jgi:vacuolar iron transporter family protein
MAQRANVQRYRENWQDEVDSAAEYSSMAASEHDPKIAEVYSNLARMEQAHIAFWEERLREAGERVGERRPSWRSRVIALIARRLGPDVILSTVVAKEAVDRTCIEAA